MCPHITLIYLMRFNMAEYLSVAESEELHKHVIDGTRVFGAIAIFWLIYDQNADTWIYFAQAHTDLRLFGAVTLTANQMQALNPVFIIVLTPVFNYIWNRAARRRGARRRTARRFCRIAWNRPRACRRGTQHYGSDRARSAWRASSSR